MAHAATLSKLANNLIASITGSHGEDARTKHLHDRTLKGLKNTSYARTNQFDINSRLDGLVEKFSVLNRDDLAEGLQNRLDALPEKSKWLPEILSLLLELSDRPLEKTRLEDVEAASRAEEEQSALTWADIIADDPLDEPGIWDDVERGYHSSDGDLTDHEGFSGDETQATSVGEEDAAAIARMHVVQVEEVTLSPIKAFQQNRDDVAAGDAVSELFLLRETLAMLHGLPTNVYVVDPGSERLRVASDVRLSTASQCVVQHGLQALADIGTSLNDLRTWTKSEQRQPTLRSCQAATSAELAQLTCQLALIDQRYLAPGRGTISSLMEVQAEVEGLVHPLTTLAQLIREDTGAMSSDSVALLDSLYDRACTAQLSGDDAIFTLLKKILDAGLNTYLRPLALWIATGECTQDDDFFVREVNSDCDLGRLWHDRYALREAGNGEPAVPIFLQSFTARIFALGKGRSFLRALGTDGQELRATFGQSHLRWHGELDDLLPFSQTLAESLEAWIDEQSRDQTPLLRTALLHDNGLLAAVDAAQEVYASANGRRFQTFADTLFWRIENGARWRDSFLLTELAQSTMGTGAGVTAESIAVQVDTEHSKTSIATTKSSSITTIQVVHVSYHLPWPLQNVTGSACSAAYSKAFTFLLQTYRAKYLLRQHIFTLRNLVDSGPSPLHNALALHQRLTTLIDILHAHTTYVTAVLSAALKEKLERAEDIDAMASIWQTHEKELEVSLLVSERLVPVKKAVMELLGMCERVMPYLNRLGRDAEADGSETEDVDVGAMHQELDRSLSFITAGIRGISRAGGNAALEQLAERLEWAVH